MRAVPRLGASLPLLIAATACWISGPDEDADEEIAYEVEKLVRIVDGNPPTARAGP